MDELLVIKISALRRAIESLLDHLEEANGPSLALSSELFWAVPEDSRYKPEIEPPELTIGKLSESWGWLLEAASSGDIVSRDLAWVSEILAAIAAEARP